ncbi:tRNA (adenine(58)-N(1))-methyltransferase non-catalytic subunit TRM6 [Elsinoe australis]|uniref:tRNA (adenine(58)-N(1))-methyltransferase non-catalytic subunit TRM6 n=1 Tax=Elsinoe australis TaxID=40998 RepID=A0A2P8A862_9PEZI|nr:tRNA (adenine(58)-N(1))-methyltransferase non-catalytic subunit TRM6 [Elsinoe australis]
MQAHIQANRHVVLRLPSDLLKIVEIIPNTSISIGKFGTFPANLLIGRPLYATYEIHDQSRATDGKSPVRLRIVPPSELNREAAFDTVPSNDANGDTNAVSTPDATAVDEEAVPIKNNRLTVDDASRQALSMHEIEELKSAVTGSGREIIERIMSSHKNLDEKTVFSLAKYTLRKMKKYLRRFTVLPIDVGTLTQWLTTDREAQRILELREESLGLLTAWSNIHVTPPLANISQGGKWLVIDDTGGLVTATVAEKLGILHPPTDLPTNQNGTTTTEPTSDSEPSDNEAPPDPNAAYTRPHPRHPTISPTNTIHLLHPASQPNLSLLKYFSYTATHPSPSHPLSSHLLPLSWLQLLTPSRDATYATIPTMSAAELEAAKPARRSAYHRKRRRWLRCKTIVDSAREGQFDGLIVATRMDLSSVFKWLVPLVKGGGTVVAYSAAAEPLVRMVDLYGRERRGAYLEGLEGWRDGRSEIETRGEGKGRDGDVVMAEGEEGQGDEEDEDRRPWRTVNEGFRPDEDDFPVDPRLLLGCSVQTSRAREWQVLPGRTHPVMTARGGGEGYVFTARRVLPFEGKVAARGNFAKKRKVEETA